MRRTGVGQDKLTLENRWPWPAFGLFVEADHQIASLPPIRINRQFKYRAGARSKPI